MVPTLPRPATLVWWALASLAVAGLAAEPVNAIQLDQNLRDLNTWVGELDQHASNRKVQEGEATAQKLLHLARTGFREAPGSRLRAVAAVAAYYYVLGRQIEAEPLLQECLALAPQVKAADGVPVVEPLLLLAQAFAGTGRYRETQRLQHEALRLAENAPQFSSALVPLVTLRLAMRALSQNQAADAEYYYRHGADFCSRELGPNNPHQTLFLLGVATSCLKQQRFAEAEAAAQRALTACERRPNNAFDLPSVLDVLALVYLATERPREALPLLLRALKLTEELKLLEKHGFIAYRHEQIARCYRLLGRLAEAETEAGRALEIIAKAAGADHHYSGAPRLELARILAAANRKEEALGHIDHALRATFTPESGPQTRFGPLLERAELCWSLGRRNEALADVSTALEQAETQRTLGTGGDLGRAQLFEGFAEGFERMAAWQAELGDAAAMLNAAERGRAQAFQDQLAMQGVSRLAGLEPREAERLRTVELHARLEEAGIQRRIDALATASAAERAQLGKALGDAKQRAALAYQQTRDASPTLRQLLGGRRQPATLQDVQHWLGQHDALILEFVCTKTSGHVLVIPPAGRAARTVALQVSPGRAQDLGVPAGPLTAERIQELITEMVLPLLSDPVRSRQAEPVLGALWEILIPQEEREALRAGRIKRLIVVPDSQLALLPLEALVVERGPQPRYLLDLDVVVSYAPSSTLLLNLANRRTEPVPPGRAPILSIADPAYEEAGQAAPSPKEPPSELPQLRYRAGGGRLLRLPNTAVESQCLAAAFRAAEREVAVLASTSATERALRQQVQQRQLVHLACHGLVDQRWGNIFGALALTPGPKATPDDDGLLTVAEIGELNLRSCELAILSACETHAGPRQRGEGIWGLSRAFHIAGAKRVVASNWLVEDQSTAALVDHLAQSLAAAERAQQPPDYALALRDAKRAVRADERWRSPFFWAAFVLSGPGR